MRLGMALQSRNLSGADSASALERLVNLVQVVENLGFSGVWVTDSLGRGSPTMDPLTVLAALCSVTKTIELGAGVVQIPLRHPVELAHRAQTLNLLSGGRLRLGVGAGSTRTDFEVLNMSYENRFETLTENLEVMQRVWRGESIHGPPISVWPGTEGGPPVFLGAWRSERWINLAATRCHGWIASGNHAGWDDMAIGIRMFREAGGQRAIVTSIHTDIRPADQRGPMSTPASINLHCSQAEARDRLQRLEDLGFDDAVLNCPTGDPEQLETIRGLL